MPLDVDYRYSLQESKTDGRWNINKEKGAITFNLPRLYSSAEKIVKKWNEKEYRYTEEDTFNLFLLHMQETEMIERVCIERAYQKIRMKGRSRCKPFCCVEKVAMLMMYPDSWGDVKVWIKEQEEKER